MRNGLRFRKRLGHSEAIFMHVKQYGEAHLDRIRLRNDEAAKRYIYAVEEIEKCGWKTTIGNIAA
jgi:hypothetical protein